MLTERIAFEEDLSKRDLFLTFLLIVCSGNPFLSQYTWLNVIFATYSVYYWTNSQLKLFESTLLRKYVLGIIAIFILQTISFMWNSVPAIINFTSKVIWGASVYLYLGEKFRWAYLKVIRLLAIASLIFWILVLFHVTVPGLKWQKGTTIIVYTYLTDYYTGSVTLRNTGFPWEPGAFGCYLVFTSIIFFRDLRFLWTNYKRTCLILLVTVLTTMSTTAYIAIFVVILLYVLVKSDSKFKIVWAGSLVALSIVVGNNTSFLREKIEHQSSSAIEAKGKFNSTRVGSMLFDLHYIKKHPFVGNGLHSKTRYSEHMQLIEYWDKGKEAFSGNGFSGIIANMGILFIILYFYILFKNNQNNLSFIDKFIICIGICLLLFGEQLMDYPLLLGYPLIKYNCCDYSISM